MRENKAAVRPLAKGTELGPKSLGASIIAERGARAPKAEGEGLLLFPPPPPPPPLPLPLPLDACPGEALSWAGEETVLTEAGVGGAGAASPLAETALPEASGGASRDP